ncbi:MAG TPA: MarR family transcriptional regulator [Steroidobacteraceae bacterium]|nr:MarR family transcriptional regulator [Steroidobacteraceae bacterium]
MPARRKPRARHAAPATIARRELLVGESDATFREFIHGLLAFSERVIAVREGFGQVIGLSGIQYTVLVSIAHLQDREEVSVGTIAAHLHFSGAFITTVTNQLQRLGLIDKARSKQDRRKANLATTAEADRLLEQLAPVQQQVNDALFASLSRSQFVEFARQMDGLVAAGDKAVALLGYLRSTRRTG